MDQTINWEGDNSYVLANPRLPQVLLPSDWEGYSRLKSHIWIATSGTTATAKQMKWIALSKRALLTSAAAVNKHINSDSSDIWLNPLPLFHVGGLSIHARAYLSAAQVYDAPPWNTKHFLQILKDKQITLASLVPAQLFDLLQESLSPPAALRAVFIGGGRLHSHLYQRGLQLGWPLLPTFGMTECCSQIATAEPGNPTLKILSHVECKVENRRLAIRSPALLTGQLIINERMFWSDPKQEGWYLTEDLVELKNNTLNCLGRLHDWIKIGGENVSLPQLEELFDLLKGQLEAHIIAAPHPRLGHQIEAATTQNVDHIINQFNCQVMPYERIRQVHILSEIPRSPLGKVLKQPLLQLCGYREN